MSGLGVVIRPVAPGDQAGLVALAGHLDTVNLPRDPAVIAELIDTSLRTFAGDDASPKSVLTFVAEDAGAIIGTASLFPRHGLPEDPHYFLRVTEQVAVSHQLGSERRRTVLRLDKDIEPWTELGGLVVHPAARGKGVGKLLLAARLLFIAAHRTRFCDRLLAELLPHRRADGGNAFWDAVGGPLTGLDFYRADLLCRADKEFIDAFFPHQELVADLLPPAARAGIGIEGPATAPVRALLRRAGFRHLDTVDPFDAGPHDGAAITEVTPIARSRRLVRLDLPPSAQPSELPRLLVMTTASTAAAVPALVAGDGLRLYHELANGLALSPGDAAWVMPLNW